MKIYYDGNYPEKYKNNVKGFTTNISFASQSGYCDYNKYIEDYIVKTEGKPCSFQVWSDEDQEIFRQSLEINSMGNNIFIKIPIIKCDGSSNLKSICQVLEMGVKVNITAVHTVEQINMVMNGLSQKKIPIIVSVFAGGITDSGRDPVPIVSHAVETYKQYSNIEILWAGCQTNLHVVQAKECGCHIITVPDNILNKMNRMELNLENTAINKVKKFIEDAQKIINLTHIEGDSKVLSTREKKERVFVPPIADRTDFCKVAEKLLKKSNNAIEIGVFTGDFAEHNLKYWTGDYYLCDVWGHRAEDAKKNLWDKNTTSEEEWNNIKNIAINKTSFAGSRVKLVQSFSVEASDQFPANFFDWIYIDAMHDYDNVKKDLESWWSKLRSGGLFSGDDYGLSEICPIDFTMTPERWSRKYGGVALHPHNKWGTLNALCEFCSNNNLFLNCTWLNDTQSTSWYIIKP